LLCGCPNGRQLSKQPKWADKILDLGPSSYVIPKKSHIDNYPTGAVDDASDNVSHATPVDRVSQIAQPDQFPQKLVHLIIIAA
jgi:hypothetical protein